MVKIEFLRNSLRKMWEKLLLSIFLFLRQITPKSYSINFDLSFFCNAFAFRFNIKSGE